MSDLSQFFVETKYERELDAFLSGAADARAVSTMDGWAVLVGDHVINIRAMNPMFAAFAIVKALRAAPQPSNQEEA